MMKLNRSYKYIFTIVFLLLICFQLEAQCPMCRTAVESNMKNGGSSGEGLNAGILYMLSMPYILVGTFLFIYFRFKKENTDTSEIADDIPRLN